MGNCICNELYNHHQNTSASLDHHPKHGLGIDAAAASETTSMIKVVTTTGGIMELYAPITCEQITSEFPNHGLFLGPNPSPTHTPLLHKDKLCPGQLYYLLPLNNTLISSATSTSTFNNDTNNIFSTPYRMSVDQVGPRVVHKNHPDPDVETRYNGTGVWKVRLVINPEYLSEILSQENKTQQLIESVRTVAKCGSGSTSSGGAKRASSVSVGSSNSSDQCSMSSKGYF